jgi:hypothetical protein
LVEVFSRAEFEASLFVGDVGDYIDEGAADVEEFLDLLKG